LLRIDTVVLRNANSNKDLRGRRFGQIGNPPRPGVRSPLRVDLSDRYDYPIVKYIPGQSIAFVVCPMAFPI